MVREARFAWDADEPLPPELSRPTWDADDDPVTEPTETSRPRRRPPRRRRVQSDDNDFPRSEKS